MIGYAICGSFCTHSHSLEILKKLSELYDIVPILSFNTYLTDTRFGKANDLMSSIKKITGKEPICSIEAAEPLGPKIKLDALIIAPCTGNTLAKLAHGITDTPVTMAAKAHMRNNRPVIIALATNDAMSANLANIGYLLNRKNVYFVPMRQDEPVSKPHSLVCDFSRLIKTYESAMSGEQLRPLFLEKV